MKLGIEKFASMLTSSYGLKVVFRGTQCHTEFRPRKGKTPSSMVIVLPELSLLERKNMTDAELEESMDFLMSVRGFVNHESAHVLFTDFKCLPKAHNPSDSKKGFLLNCLEDLRIETKLSSMYVGAQQSLDHLQDWVMRKLAATFKAGPPSDRFRQLIYAINAAGKHRDVTTHLLWGYIEPDLQALCLRFQKKIRRARNAGSTKEIIGLRDEIWAAMKDEYEEEKRKEKEKRARMKAAPSEPGGTPEPGEGGGEGGEGTPSSGTPKKRGKKSKPSKSEEKVDDGEGGDSGGAEDAEKGSEDEDAAGPGEDDREDEEAADEGDGDPSGDGGGEDEDDSEDADGDDAKDSKADAPEDEPGDAEHDEPSSDGESEKPHMEEEERDKSADAKPDEKEEVDRLFEEDERVDETAAPKSVSKAMEDFMRDEVAPKARERGAYDDRYLVYTTEQDIRVPVADLSDKRVLDHGKLMLAKIEDETRSLYGPVKRTLDARLRSRALAYRVGDLTEGELDRATLYRLPMELGDSIFSQEVSAQSLKNTAVSLLFDASGSMGGKIPMLKKTLLCFAEPLHMMRVPFNAIGFTGMHLPDELVPPSYEDRVIYGRWRGYLKIPVLKEFHESWPTVKPRLGYVEAECFNYDGEAVRLAAQELISRPEKRKVLFVLSDGSPGEAGHEAVYHNHLKSVTTEIESRGLVEVVGIGIQDDSVRRYYKRNFVVNNLADLPKMVLAELGRQLLT